MPLGPANSAQQSAARSMMHTHRGQSGAINGAILLQCPGDAASCSDKDVDGCRCKTCSNGYKAGAAGSCIKVSRLAVVVHLQ